VPLTLKQHERKLHDPALCEQLPIRDYPGQHRRPHQWRLCCGLRVEGFGIVFRERPKAETVGSWMLEALLRSRRKEYEGTVPLRSSGRISEICLSVMPKRSNRNAWK